MSLPKASRVPKPRVTLGRRKVWRRWWAEDVAGVTFQREKLAVDRAGNAAAFRTGVGIDPNPVRPFVGNGTDKTATPDCS